MNQASGATFTVVNTNEMGPGSWHQAILDANANVGRDDILFDIPGGGPHTLFVRPVFTDAVLVDGYSQPSSRPNTLVDGNSAVIQIRLAFGTPSFVNPTFRISANDCTIRGLSIVRVGEFGAGNAITIEGSRNVVEGCYVGVDTDGITVFRRGAGDGIVFNRSAVDNRIGGRTPEARNVISGNVIGIRLDGTNNTVEGNVVGTDATGRTTVGNNGAGIALGGYTNLVGGPTPGAGNVISGNVWGIGDNPTGSGIGSTIQGNLIGTDISGTKKLPNESGMWFGISHHFLIGGTTPGSGNVISGNSRFGIFFNSAISSWNVVQGNFIGTDRSRTLNLGNGLAGVEMLTWDHQVGGLEPGAGNTIAYNGGNGITGLNNWWSPYQSPNRYSGNSIYANGGKGIRTFFPSNSFLTLNSAFLTATGVVVRGSMNAAPNSPYHIEIFSNGECDTSGRGEGATFLGHTNFVTDAIGHGDFVAGLPHPPPGEYLFTATATDFTNATSEFSACLELSVPKLTISGMSDNSAVLSWPHWEPEFKLQRREGLIPLNLWQPVMENVISDEFGWHFIVNPGANDTYYRLAFP